MGGIYAQIGGGRGYEDNMAQSAWASARIGKRMDTELAIQLRIMLRVDFEQAASWSELRRALRNKGFSLQAQRSGLRLVDSISRVDICSTSVLGFSLAQLEREFGAPIDSVKWHNWLIG